MKIFVTGTRGIPGIPGGVEKHCEELYPRIAAQGHDVVICTRDFYVQQRSEQWRGVKLLHCYAPHRKSMEAIVHTFLSLWKARRLRPDIVHIHAVGPALLTPLARLLGFKVVVTHHGPDYERQKWGPAAKALLRLGEKLGGLFAHEVIAVSSVAAGIVRARCRREATVIHNGVPLPSPSGNRDYLDKLGVANKGYILAVARFVPEKGLHDLIDAYSSLDLPYRLVIAGDADHETEYSRYLRRVASADPRIVLTGYITGEALHQVYGHARLFVLPSYHEGLPIALLEALSYGLSVLVSDIPANREVELPANRYFRCGDGRDLKTKMRQLVEKELSESEREQLRKRLQEQFDWQIIAEKTVAVYRRAVGTMKGHRSTVSEAGIAGSGK